jgi:hypothetical protein
MYCSPVEMLCSSRIACVPRLLERLRTISHVEVIRICTRVPVFLPQRITSELVELLRRFHPFWINIHCNHPQELAPEVEQALARLAVPLRSQSVLMAGINDCPQIMLALVHKLVKNRGGRTISTSVTWSPWQAISVRLLPGAWRLWRRYADTLLSRRSRSMCLICQRGVARFLWPPIIYSVSLKATW